MHTGHILLVEAESHEEALDKVRSAIEYADNPTPSWSDWHEIGGRWSDYLGKYGYVMCYDKDEHLAEEKIHDMVQSRVSSMLGAWEQVKNFDIEAAIASYLPDKGGFDMNPYYLKKIAETLNNEWTPDSHVYDLESWTSDLKYFRERLAIAPEMQYLVVVDFHF